MCLDAERVMTRMRAEGWTGLMDWSRERAACGKGESLLSIKDQTNSRGTRVTESTLWDSTGERAKELTLIPSVRGGPWWVLSNKETRCNQRFPKDHAGSLVENWFGRGVGGWGGRGVEWRQEVQVRCHWDHPDLEKQQHPHTGLDTCICCLLRWTEHWTSYQKTGVILRITVY